LLTALGVFVLASLVGGLTSNGTVLIYARFLKGAASAFTAPAGLSIITTSFAEGPERNRALSLSALVGRPVAAKSASLRARPCHVLPAHSRTRRKR